MIFKVSEVLRHIKLVKLLWGYFISKRNYKNKVLVSRCILSELKLVCNFKFLKSLKSDEIPTYEINAEKI